jgi:hypothetical protein
MISKSECEFLVILVRVEGSFDYLPHCRECRREIAIGERMYLSSNWEWMDYYHEKCVADDGYAAADD